MWCLLLFISILPLSAVAQRKKKKDKVKEDMTLIDKDKEGNSTNMSASSDGDTTAVIQEEKQVTLYKKGLKLIDSSEYKNAVAEFKKAVKIKKDYYEAWLKMGYCKMKMEDYEGAEADLQRASETGPNDFETLKLKGMNYFFMGEQWKVNRYLDSARKFLDSASTLYEDEKIDDAEFHYYRGKLMFKGKGYKKALEECNIALEVNPKYYDAMILKCEVRFAQKEWAYALKELNETIKVLPEKLKNYDLYKMRAKTKFEIKDFKGSIQDWSAYIDNDSKNEEAYIWRAMARININDFTNAIVDCDAAIQLNPKNCVSWCFRGFAKGANKQFIEGIKDLDQSIKLKFDYSVAYVNRASLKRANGDKRGACEDLQKADSLGNELAPGLYEQYCK
jgi:tetratricopeptide (TPR) repeat protein